jgi:hypothetical protein
VAADRRLVRPQSRAAAEGTLQLCSSLKHAGLIVMPEQLRSPCNTGLTWVECGLLTCHAWLSALVAPRTGAIGHAHDHGFHEEGVGRCTGLSSERCVAVLVTAERCACPAEYCLAALLVSLSIVDRPISGRHDPKE